MTLAVYYPFSQTEWYRASLAYLDLQHQGLVVLMLLLARADGEQRASIPSSRRSGSAARKGIFGAGGASRHPARRNLRP